MIEFDFAELNLLSKLLSKVKYSELDAYELNQFANSPITNNIMDKIKAEFNPQADKIPRIANSGAPKFQFKLENYVGNAITKRLEKMDVSVFKTIAEWDKTQTQKFATDILGSIDYSFEELNNLTEYLMETARRKTVGNNV